MNKLGINSNMMKIIAFIAVIFDHIGVYFYSMMPENITIYFRIIGRIAMPIFAFLIVQGFFHTKDLTKYVKRLFITGIITQLIIYILFTMNNYFFINYKVLKNVLNVNILISFAISLIILKTIDTIYEKVIKKEKIIKQDILLIIVSIILLSLYFITKFDYSYTIIIYIILIYFIEKIVIQKNVVKDKYTSKLIYILLQFIALLIFTVIYNSSIEYFAILSVIVIALYNKKRGKDNKLLRHIFYIFYPLQHLVLYLMALIIQ